MTTEKRKRRWCNLILILPAITFLYSLLEVFHIAVFDTMTGSEVFGVIASTFLVSNIPTIVLLGIYFVCRKI